jgi:glutamate 5-kinase
MLQFIKMGTSCLFTTDGEINRRQLQEKAWQIQDREKRTDDKTVLVVSGAIGLGKQAEGETRANSEIKEYELQGYASVGQRMLMDHFATYFDRHVAQVLLTVGDMGPESELRALVEENLRRGRMTIVNYNDSIDFAELRKDNDTLAAQLANYCGAERLVILGTYNGFRDGNGNLIERVTQVEQAHFDMCNGSSADGNGGFRTKLEAAQMMLAHGHEMIVGNVAYDLSDVIEGRVTRTLFRAEH